MNGTAKDSSVSLSKSGEYSSSDNQRFLEANNRLERLEGGSRYQAEDEVHGNNDTNHKTSEQYSFINSQNELLSPNDNNVQNHRTTHLQIGICRLCVYLRARVNCLVTLRGLPRLFLVRRAFCLYWAIVVILLVYLKLYFPLYLTSTVSRNTLEEFRRDWCLVRSLRTDWKLLQKPCIENMARKNSTNGFEINNQTSSEMSYVSHMNIRPAGEFSRFTIQSQTAEGLQRFSGGDSWRIFIRGPSVFTPTVLDHGNGTYEVIFLVLEPGTYRAEVSLDYSICDELRELPDYWPEIGRYAALSITANDQSEPKTARIAR